MCARDRALPPEVPTQPHEAGVMTLLSRRESAGERGLPGSKSKSGIQIQALPPEMMTSRGGGSG